MEAVLSEIKTMCVRAEGGPLTSKAAFDKLESKLVSLRGRKFYGAIQDGICRACVELIPDDKPEELGFEVYTIPGGKYTQERIVNWFYHLKDIGPTFIRMANQHEEDPTRPKLEFYKSQKELVLLLPVR